MPWLQTDHGFPERAAVFTIAQAPRRDNSIEINPNLIIDALEKSDPDQLEEAMLSMVLTARPELEGCTIWFMNFNPMAMQYEVGVSHASLPQCNPGVHAERTPLCKETAARQAEWKNREERIQGIEEARAKHDKAMGE